MGVFIQGVNIPKRTKKPTEGQKVFCYKGFERGLLKTEQTYRDYDLDPCTKNSLGVSYGYYNHIRNVLCESFLNSTPEKIWSRCGNLGTNQKYGRNLYYLINFADNEGYIGPTAVKKISKYLTPQRVQKALKKMNKEARPWVLELIDTIHETAKMPRGYLVFS